MELALQNHVPWEQARSGASQRPKGATLAHLSLVGSTLAWSAAHCQRTGWVAIASGDEARLNLVVTLAEPGLGIVEFASVDDLLATEFATEPSCLLLDPGDIGLHEDLIARGIDRAVIYVSERHDVPTCVRAMRAGALDFIAAPVRPAALRDTLRRAIEEDADRLKRARSAREIAQRIASLTVRERQVMEGVAHGRLNKQIAFDLGISEITVKVHRGNLMRKLRAHSIADLVRAWDAHAAR
jgi:FixJ family two-component response regulator